MDMSFIHIPPVLPNFTSKNVKSKSRQIVSSQLLFKKLDAVKNCSNSGDGLVLCSKHTFERNKYLPSFIF